MLLVQGLDKLLLPQPVLVDMGEAHCHVVLAVLWLTAAQPLLACKCRFAVLLVGRPPVRLFPRELPRHEKAAAARFLGFDHVKPLCSVCPDELATIVQCGVLTTAYNTLLGILLLSLLVPLPTVVASMLLLLAVLVVLSTIAAVTTATAPLRLLGLFLPIWLAQLQTV